MVAAGNRTAFTARSLSAMMALSCLASCSDTETSSPAGERWDAGELPPIADCVEVGSSLEEQHAFIAGGQALHHQFAIPPRCGWYVSELECREPQFGYEPAR